MHNVLITGTNRGLGQDIADRFQETESVFRHARTGEVDLKGDISSFDLLDRLDTFLEEYAIDVFINNAAVKADKENVTEAFRTINTNVTCTIELLDAVWQHFKEKGGGTIINISSIACLYPGPDEAIYAASKSAIRTYLQGISQKDKSIKICNVLVGAMKTEMAECRSDYDNLIYPEEVADTVYWIGTADMESCFPSEIVIRRSQ